MLRSVSILALGAALATSPVDAQVVHGTVVQLGTQRPLRDVAVTLRTTAGRRLTSAVSDTAGKFRLLAPRIGDYEVVGELIGFTTVASPLTVGLGEQVEVVLRMDVTAVPIEPLEVRARSPYDLGMLSEFYERMQRYERAGIGRFITRDQIDERGALDVVDLLRDIPRIAVVADRNRGPHVMIRGGVRGECTPMVYLNGMLVNRRGDRAHVDELVRPSDLEGIEVYTGLAQLPGIYHDETGCGVIVMWTRRGDTGGRPFKWWRVAIALGLAALVVVIAR